MSDKRKILILCFEEKTVTKLQATDAITKLGKEATLKWSSYSSFMEGKRHDTFDAVFLILCDTTYEDLELGGEYYQHYASAPIIFALWEKYDNTNYRTDLYH
jgi:hypothetical protein